MLTKELIMQLCIGNGMYINDVRQIVKMMKASKPSEINKEKLAEDILDAVANNKSDDLMSLFQQLVQDSKKSNEPTLRNTMLDALTDFVEAYTTCDTEALPLISIQAFMFSLVKENHKDFATEMWHEFCETMDKFEAEKACSEASEK